MPKGENASVSDRESASSSGIVEPKVSPAAASPSKKPSALTVGSKGKGKRKDAGAARKEKGMPSRPLSAYNLYFREARLHLMSESPRFQGQERSNNPGLFAELGKAIAERWKSVSDEELSRYKKLAALDMERYSREMSEYRLKRAKFRLSEESAAAAASSSKAPAAGAKQQFSLASCNSVVEGNERSPAPPTLPAFLDASLLRTNALLRSLQRTSDYVAPASYHRMAELTRSSSSVSEYQGLSPLRNASALTVNEPSSLRSPAAQRQGIDGFAIAQALRIQQLEGIIARQDLQRRLQHGDSLDRQLAAGALDRDRLAFDSVYAGAASALAAESQAGSAVPPFGFPDAAGTSASAWGGHPLETPRMPGTLNRDVFPSFFRLSSTQSLLRSTELDDPASTSALLRQLLSQQSQQAQNQQLLQQLRQQHQQPYRPPSPPPLDPATHLLLLQQLMNQRSPDRSNSTTGGDSSHDSAREST